MGRVISTALRFIDGFTKPSKAVIDSMNKMAKNIKQNAQNIQSAGKAISSVGSTMTKGITLPIVGIATAATKTAADFEAAMSKVGAIAGAVKDNEISGIVQKAKEMRLSFKEGADITETAMNILKAKAQQMGAITSFSASESAEAMQYMAMAGWKTADMMDGIAGIMNLAAASGEELAATSDIVTDGLTAFGMAAKESSRFADVMAATSSSANTNVALMGETFKYCASTAGAMGYSIEDISVAIGIMGNAGIKGSMAGTTLKNTIANLAKPTASQAKVMKRLGISLTDSSGNMKSFAGVMDNLRAAFSGLSETEKAAAATTLAGKQSMAGLLTIVNASTEDFDNLTAAINGSSGSAETMAGKMLDNLNGQLTLLKSAVEGILITIGDKLLPHIKKAVSWFQTAADYINGLSDAQVNNIMKWAGIAAAIGPVILIFGKMVTMVGSVYKTWGSAVQMFAKFGGTMGMLKSPAAIVIGVLAAIALAAFLIIKNWDQVKGFLQNVGNWFKTAFEKSGLSVQSFKDKFASIKNTIGSIADKISGFCKSIADVFKKDFASGIKAGAKEAGDILQDLVGGVVLVFDGIVTAVDQGLKVFDALLSFFTGAFAGEWDSAAQNFRNSLKNIFPPDIANGLIKAFNTALPAIKAVASGLKTMFGGLVQDVKKIFGSIETVFSGIGTMLKGIFAGDAKTAMEGFKTAVGGAIDTVGNVIKAKLNAVKNFVTGALSTFLPESAVKKITGAFDAVINTWDKVTGAFRNVGNIKNVFIGLGDKVKNVMTRCGVDMDKFGAALDNIKTRASNITGNLKTIFSTTSNAIGKAVKAVSGFISGLFGQEIDSSCNAAMAAFTAFKIVAKAAFDDVVGGIKLAIKIIGPVLKVGFGGALGAVTSIIHSITSVVSGLFTVFDGLTTFISGVFTGNWRQAWEGVKTIFQGAFESLAALCKAPINAVIGIINGAISAINGISVTIPDWVPGMGGKSFGINIPTIPMLYKGTDNWKGGMAMIHDRGGEIVDLPRGSRVYPHDKSIELARKEGAKSSQGISITIQKLADKIEVRSDEDIDRIAEALAYKLKKIALNMGTA